MGIVDKVMPLILEPAGKYPHNPLVGARPMKYAYTLSAQFAQFPFVLYWRYTKWMRPLAGAFIIVQYINWPITKLVKSPENIEKWRQTRLEWYTKKIDPEDAYF